MCPQQHHRQLRLYHIPLMRAMCRMTAVASRVRSIPPSRLAIEGKQIHRPRYPGQAAQVRASALWRRLAVGCMDVGSMAQPATSRWRRWLKRNVAKLMLRRAGSIHREKNGQPILCTSGPPAISTEVRYAAAMHHPLFCLTKHRAMGIAAPRSTQTP